MTFENRRFIKRYSKVGRVPAQIYIGHITVILNGVKVIDNQPVTGPTAGAVFTNPTQPGPIYLQGDHTSVRYRSIYLAPVMKD